MPRRRRIDPLAPWRPVLRKVSTAGLLVCGLVLLAIVDAVVFPTVGERVEALMAARDEGEPVSTPAAAPVPGEEPADEGVAPAEVRSAFEHAMADVRELVHRERYRRALERLDRVDRDVRDTPLWRELAGPEVRRLEVLASALDAYRDFETRARRRIDDGDLEGARTLVERFPFDETPYGADLEEIVAHAPIEGGAEDTLGPGAELVEVPESGRDRDPGEATTSGGDEDAGHTDGADDGDGPTPTPDADVVVALPRWEGRPGRYWAVRSAFSRELSTRAARFLDLAERFVREILGRSAEPPAEPQLALIYDAPDDARRAPEDAALVTAGQGSGDMASVVDRVVRDGVEAMLRRELGEAYAEVVPWVRRGLPLYLATLTTEDGRSIAYTASGDERRRRFLAAGPPDAEDLADLVAAEEVDGRDELTAWALAFYLLQSTEAREAGNHVRLARYLRRLRNHDPEEGDEPPPAFLSGEDPRSLGTLAEHVRRFIRWGDVREYPIEREEDWIFVFLPGLRIQTQMEADVAREISFFFQGLYREYGRFYSELLDVEEKTVYRARLRLFDSKEAFDDWNARRGNEGTRAHWNPGSNEVVMYNESGEFGENVPTLYHEFSHRFTQVYVPGATTWANEGLATYMGSARRELRRYRYGNIAGSIGRVRAALENGSALPLRELTTLTYDEFHDSPDEGLHYAQSCTLVHFLIHGNPEIVPPTAARDFFRGAAAGRCGWRALEEVLDRPIAEIERQWEAHVRNYRGR